MGMWKAADLFGCPLAIETSICSIMPRWRVAMTRRKQRRFVAEIPEVTVFKPQGIPMGMLQEIVLELDEYEAIRLVDLEGL
ncbi:MAG TPA: hypothetical protein DEW46_14665, partial [Verrucomicrobia bacterium]|nr:hypothetical protein [Verrucomicrobiota bacterium]